MLQFVPDGLILCEVCYKHFIAYKNLYMRVDLDAKNEVTHSIKNHTFNKITCPYCHSEFTHENSVFYYSYLLKTVVVSQYPDEMLNVGSFPVAAKIAGMDNWNFRRCDFSIAACEKFRIFQNELDDCKMEILKVRAFPDYRKMDLTEEHICFESRIGKNLIFTHRDFTEKVLNEYTIPISQYDDIPCVKTPTGDWIVIDRDWALRFLEDEK